MKRIIYYILFAYVIIAIFTIIFFNGTGDAGDSILHYLFAKYAPVHPELFFDQWAKPVFVLLAFPFAHFGFNGIKVFNALLVLLTIFFTYKSAEALNIRNAVLCAVFLVFTPLYYILTFSGLTEPLFAFTVAFILFLSVEHKYIAAGIILSFLPFIRSEGYIIMGVFLFYLIIKKQWRVIPYLLVGSAAYTISGVFFHHDIFWVFKRIPYANMSSPYGSGKIFHFADQLYYIIGLPIYVLFVTGFVSLIAKVSKFRKSPEEIILVFVGFLAFFVAHSLFWYLGIFNSMGLKRVFIGVIPLIAIIALMGFNFATENRFMEARKKLKLMIQTLFVLYVMIFPFTSNPAAIQWKRDMTLSRDQLMAIEAAQFVKERNRGNGRLFCCHPYLSEVLHIDWFDQNKRMSLSVQDLDHVMPSDLIIWENWFSVVESNIRKSDIEQHPGFVNLLDIKADDHGREIEYSVYQKID